MKNIAILIMLLLAYLLLTACELNITDTATAENTPVIPTATMTVQPSETPAEVEFIAIDDEWNRYTNHRLGISIEVPNKYYRDDADCYWQELENDSSYRPLGGFVPVAVIEGQDRIFITGQFYSELTQSTQIPSGNGYHTVFAGCEQGENDLARMLAVEGTSYYWEIVVWDIASMDDLEALVDAVYGECFNVGEMSPVEGREYQSVRVQGDGKPVEESTCLLRGGYIFYYSAEMGKAATWYTGQSYHFPADAEYREAYDSQMVKSFDFISG